MPNINVRSFTPSGSAAFKSLILAKPHNIVNEVKKIIKDKNIMKCMDSDCKCCYGSPIIFHPIFWIKYVFKKIIKSHIPHIINKIYAISA